MSIKPLVHVEGLTKCYGKLKVLDSISLSISGGRIVGLLGPNGSGKTTLIKILAGVMCDYNGTVEICGMRPSRETKALVAYLPDRISVPKWMTARQLIGLYSDFFSDFDSERAELLCRRFSVRLEQRFLLMSKGSQERLLIALTMSRRARLYLLDEPLGAVDPAARSAILGLLLESFSEDSTVLLTTHMVSDVENIFDDVVFLGYDGITFSGEAEALRSERGKSIDSIFKEEFSCCEN